MDFIVTANTDIGLVKQTNQDSLTVKIINTDIGRMAFAVLCDGMGGLAMGEVASAAVVRAFDDWVYTCLPELSRGEFGDDEIQVQWESLLQDMNRRIADYGRSRDVRLGTTAVILLVTRKKMSNQM